MQKVQAELNRLMEQFADSGIIGGLSYVAWIGLLLWSAGKKIRCSGGWFEFAIFAGLLGWFGQGLIEFGLYVPALAWTAFTRSQPVGYECRRRGY